MAEPLQHPGIPPVHALGRLEDGRPYFVMKLIQGRSLEELLKEQFSREPRASVATDLPRLVGIFEHICQTVGYAHARGVIHRDLKPANVMVALAEGGRELLDGHLAGQLADLGEVLAADEKDWALAKDLDDLRIETVTPVTGRMELHRAAEKYPLVFVKGGLDVWDGELSDVANRVVRSPIRYALVAALDDWASRTSDPKLLPRLLAVARKADPDPWRDRFRDEKVSNDPKELQGLIKDLRPEQQSPQVMLALALRLGGEEHARLLRRALPHHTRDFWLYFQLGSVSNGPLEKIACNQAAVAVRPRSALAHFNLGDALLRKRRDLEAAIIQLRTAIQLNPDFAAAYNHLGLALLNKKDLDGAIAQYRKAIQLDPSFPLAHANLRVALFAKTALEEVVTPLRKASKQKPTKP